MPIEIANTIASEGPNAIPYLPQALKVAPWIALLALLKWYFGGARNKSERDMHSKVVMITGGTSGVGASVLKDLATRGAQIVLLTQHALSDPFLVDFIEDVRAETGNELITAEQVDLSSLHSIRQFATKWIDNSPVRRLDMVVFCANTIGAVQDKHKQQDGKDNVKGKGGEGVELVWQVNYLANFHLLSILSPALRAQPPDRDVRILLGTCSSYLSGDLLHITQPPQSSNKAQTLNLTEPTRISPHNAYPTTKLALTTFALAFQKHLTAYVRPDNFPMNTKVLLIDPGLCRTPGTRRWLSWGSLTGLLLYLLFYPIWWLVLKSPEQGAQGFLYGAMESRFGRLRQPREYSKGAKESFEGLVGDVEAEDGGWYVKECSVKPLGREDVRDEEAQRRLWEFSERMIEEAEKKGKAYRARKAKEDEERVEEVEAEREMKDYRERIGRKEGNRKEGSRRSRKAG